MKETKTYSRWLLASLLIIAVIIAACGPATTTEAPTSDDSHSAESSDESHGEEADHEESHDEEAVEESHDEESTDEDHAEPVEMGDALTTDSGLQYIEIEAGDGAAPNAGDLVSVHYTGTLEDGTEFDSSAGGQPIQFPLGAGYVIPGWDEGIALMREGGKAQLIIPPDLGYGELGQGAIPANATLYFDVELVSVEVVPTPTPPPPPTSFDDSDYTTTDSGIKYAVITEGDGETPQEGEVVEVHFVGWVADDLSSIGDSRVGLPLQFAVGNEEILPGWDEAVTLMQVGETTQFVFPPELAFGEEGVPGLVPPNSEVIFELDLVSVSPAPPTPTPAPPPTDVDEEDYRDTKNGVKIFTIEEGDGPAPQLGDTVFVNYRLWLEDGTQIDNSYDRGQPYPFVVGSGQTIPGWEEGILNMVLGETAQILVPPELGYGDADSGPIPGGSTLIFEITIEDIQSGE